MEQCQFLLQVSLRVFDAKLKGPSAVHDILVGQLTNGSMKRYFRDPLLLLIVIMPFSQVKLEEIILDTQAH